MTSEQTDALLQIEDLHVSVGDREILQGVDLTILEGETHVLLGPNGGGKTTLLNTIVGMPGYRVTRGRILFKGIDLDGMEIDERARLGIGIAFQRPPAVRGVKLRQIIGVAAHGQLDDAAIERLNDLLSLDHMLERDANMGFSGAKPSVPRWRSCSPRCPICPSSTSPRAVWISTISQSSGAP